MVRVLEATRRALVRVLLEGSLGDKDALEVSEVSRQKRSLSWVDVVWAGLTGPVVVFAVSDFIFKRLSTPWDSVVPAVALLLCIGAAWRWESSQKRHRR